MGEELDVERLKGIMSRVLSDFAPRMGHKWDFIGIQLKQGSLVQELRSSPELGRKKVQHIIDEWLASEDEDLPVCAETVLTVLRSPAVKLGAVAKDFEKKFGEKLQLETEKLRKTSKRLPGTHPPAADTTSNLESASTDGNGQHSPSSVSLGVSSRPSDSRDPVSLIEAEQPEDGQVNPSMEKDGGGQDEGAVSLLQDPVEEHGQPTMEDVQRGSERDGEVHDGPGAAGAVLHPNTMQRAGTGGRQSDAAPSFDQGVNEVAMVESIGQRCIPFLDLLQAAAAVCRIRWDGQNRDGQPCTYYGSGSFVKDAEQFFLLTCCHNFLTKEEGKRENLQSMPSDDLREKLRANCKVALYEVSDSTTSKTVIIEANHVLLDHENPRLYFEQDKDLLAIRVRNPADCESSEPISLKPIPLKPDVDREADLLPGARVFALAQFPWGKYKARKPLEISIGEKSRDQGRQGQAVVSDVRYELDAYEGSSGSPLLYCTGDGEHGIVVMAVHLRGATRGQLRTPVCNVGAVLTQTFLSSLREKLYD